MRRARVGACGLLLAGTLLASQPASAGSVNDLLVDFGSRGLWVFLNNSTWRQLHARDPSAVAACDDGTIYAGFPGGGLLRRTVAASSWETVRADLVPFRMATGDTDGNDVCDIGANMGPETPQGHSKLLIGLNHASGWITLWNRSHDLGNFAFGNFDGSPNDDIVAASPDLGATMGTSLELGYNNLRIDHVGWGSANDPKTGDIDGDGLDEIVQIGGGGVYAFYDTAPTRTWPGILPTQIVQAEVAGWVEVGDLDADPRDDILYEVYRDGLWAIYNNSGFPGVKLDSRVVSHLALAIADLDSNGTGDVIASFGFQGYGGRSTGQGVWVRYGPSGFQLLRGWRVGALVPCACD